MKVRIIDISEDDAYYHTKDDIIGIIGDVVGKLYPIRLGGDGWVSACIDVNGKELYFYEVKCVEVED